MFFLCNLPAFTARNCCVCSVFVHASSFSFSVAAGVVNLCARCSGSTLVLAAGWWHASVGNIAHAKKITSQSFLNVIPSLAWRKCGQQAFSTQINAHVWFPIQSAGTCVLRLQFVNLSFLNKASGLLWKKKELLIEASPWPSYCPCFGSRLRRGGHAVSGRWHASCDMERLC